MPSPPELPTPDPRAAPAVDPSIEPSTGVISGWLAEWGRIVTAIEPLAGDVSTRCYFRIRLAGDPLSRIVARYPPELAAAQRRFAPAARLLARAGVRVPEIELDDPGRGLALLEDLGPRTLHEAFPGWASCPAELGSALEAAAAIARLPLDEVATLGSPPLDEALLRRELAMTAEHFLVPLGLARPALLDALDELCAALAAAPAVPCHRDYMARNLVPAGDGAVAVLDFQDLRPGPPGYDLASLLNDSFFAPPEIERRALASEAGRGVGELDYRRAVVQRALKAVGTFLAFAARGKRRHLPLVEPTLARALAAAAQVPETARAAAEYGPALAEGGRAAALC